MLLSSDFHDFLPPKIMLLSLHAGLTLEGSPVHLFVGPKRGLNTRNRGSNLCATMF